MRELELVVISDVHLGTFGCRAKELNNYLKSINPKTLILNGDIIDIWQFKKNYFPKSHLKVIKRIIGMSSNGTKLIYITGNHDEMLRKFSNSKLGNIEIVNKKVLMLNQKKAWFFHGDVFDLSMKHSKVLAKIGGLGYDLLIRLNAFSNYILKKLGKEKYSFSKKIKNGVKKAVSFINDFENVAIDLALAQNYDYVVCGHIHSPAIKIVKKNNKEICYLNSGDWIENLSALEYNQGKWELYYYNEKEMSKEYISDVDIDSVENMTYEQLVSEISF